MTGLLASQSVRVSQARIGESLRRTIPHNHQKRITSTAKLLNPVLNTAEYFGHKVHVDQNKKLVMYGVTHVYARDGYSGKVVGFITLPVKTTLRSINIFSGTCKIYNYIYYIIYYINMDMCITLHGYTFEETLSFP